jgi:hypothetical protein
MLVEDSKGIDWNISVMVFIIATKGDGVQIRASYQLALSS